MPTAMGTPPHPWGGCSSDWWFSLQESSFLFQEQTSPVATHTLHVVPLKKRATMLFILKVHDGVSPEPSQDPSSPMAWDEEVAIQFAVHTHVHSK